VSHFGIYPGLYSRIRRYAELLDNVLVELKSGETCGQTPNRKQLGQLLVHLEDRNRGDVSAQFLQLVLNRREPSALQQWAKVGRTLLSDEIPQTVIKELEGLADTLERERIDAAIHLRHRQR
jgi:Trp operon repressor